MKRLWMGSWGIVLLTLLLAPDAKGSGYDSDSPWPSMRHDYLNTGRADNIHPSQIPDLDSVEMWSFNTDRPIFSTPVVGADGTVFIGSADCYFYAINPDGTLKWKFRTDRLIDSAACLSDNGRVYVPSGDSYIYALDQQTGSEHWRFKAFDPREDRVEVINWWEGNVSLTPEGDILAGNDDFHVYQISQEGSLKYLHDAQGMNQIIIPTDPQGRHFFSSLDRKCYAVDDQGNHLWTTGFWGIFISSPSIGPNGAVYVGCFDGNVYSLDPDTGKINWTFKTGDHVYSSVAIAKDDTLYVGSTDGSMYALIDQGDDVKVKWAYDTLAPIRSSPVIDGDGNIYFGNENGELFVLNPDGTRRWSVNLTESDMNDINASLALGEKAVYVAMQDGRVIQVPYEYGLNHDDKRCNADPGEDMPSDGAFIYWMTPGGEPITKNDVIADVLPASVITLRLVVRKDGDTLMAGMDQNALKVVVNPWFPHHVTVSMDHRFINIIPHEPLEREKTYTVKVSGSYRKPWAKLLGNIWLIGGRNLGDFESEARFTVAQEDGMPFTEGDPILATHLSYYQPWIFPSVAQIGMDDMNFIIVPVEKLDPGVWTAWGVVAAPGADGNYYPEPGNRVTLPFKIEYQGDVIKIAGQNLEFDHAGDRLGLKYFFISGQLEQPDHKSLMSKNILYTEGKYFSMAGSFYNVPVFGTPLSGTLRINKIELPDGPPAGFEVVKLSQSGNKITVAYKNESGLTTDDNNLSIMLINNKTREPIQADYAKITSHITDEAGRIVKTEVKLPFKYKGDDLFAVVFLNAVELARLSVVAENLPGTG